MIEVDRLTKRYGSTVAVDDLSFQVLPGRVTGFLGPNGAGKSTTMRAVVGLDLPTMGEVRVNGRSYASIRRPLCEVGALLDASAVHGGRSASSHLLCIARSNGIGPSRVNTVLEMVGLATVARRRIRTFSLGMLQRLGVATALLGNPGVLLFDEPVNGLDPEGIWWIRALMKQLAAEGRTVLVSSHLMSEMALTADHLVVIGRGRLVTDASVTDLLSRSSRNRVRVRSPQAGQLSALLTQDRADVRVQPGPDSALEVLGMDAPAVGELAAAHGVVLHELSTQQASLEEAFMDLTRDSVDYRTGLDPLQATSPNASPGTPTTVGSRP
ncbi:ABC transporter ATP-binding protein [Protofrankia coriariae]|uniref:Multidrug ABC transporter ATP-binding protein n=1 Tax=Protofrankia coriariae TaxID=1562887 RepID=A0ABR5F472_9ACTN|nr:ATP-binding cassette domain-containing protein [Protofrankia coriariae]KLL11521.1 multidrug ABC transporter ATP-binding protein [Protofrankia coriariae]